VPPVSTLVLRIRSARLQLPKKWAVLQCLRNFCWFKQIAVLIKIIKFLIFSRYYSLHLPENELRIVHIHWCDNLIRLSYFTVFNIGQRKDICKKDKTGKNWILLSWCKRVLLWLVILHYTANTELVVWTCTVVLPSEWRTSCSSFVDNCRVEPFSCNRWLLQGIIPCCMYLVIYCVWLSITHRLQRVLFVRQSFVFGHNMSSSGMSLNITSLIITAQLN
jgi:hypothetical protein